MKKLEENYKAQAICLIANIPDNLNDNDSVLIKSMQDTFENYFNEYIAIIAGKTLIERIEGCSFTVPDIECMKTDFIDELILKLTRFDLMKLKSKDRIKIRRFLSFIEKQKNIIPKVIKPINDTLELACKGEAEYKSIREWFIKEDFCNSDPFIWKPSQRRAGHKTILAYCLRDLFHKGYVKEISHQEMKDIALKSFGVKISIGTIKTSKVPTYKLQEIPRFK